MKMFDPSKVEAGKELRTLVISSVFLVFWSFAAFADIFDGAIKVKGSSASITFATDQFWYVFWLFVIVGIEGLAIINAAFVALVCLRRRK
jgi:hypothetical protein